MNTTNAIPQLGPEFWKYIIDTVLKAMDDSKMEAIQILWGHLLSFLSIHWGIALLYLTGLLILSFIIALVGRWGMFGSVAYHYLHLGTLFIIGLIFGPNIFANNYFELLNLVIYICSFRAVGVIIDSLGLRRRVNYI